MHDDDDNGNTFRNYKKNNTQSIFDAKWITETD